MTFFKDNSYTIVKMMLYQFGMTLMGMITALAAVSSKNNALLLLVSLYSSILYLALLYMMTWDLGGKDHIRADAGIVKADRYAGLKLSLWANLPNFLVTLFIGIGYLFGEVLGAAPWAQTMFGIAHTFGLVAQSMYYGIIELLIPSATTVATSGAYLVAYALTPLPAIAICTFGYLMGYHDRRLFGFMGKKNSK